MNLYVVIICCIYLLNLFEVAISHIYLISIHQLFHLPRSLKLFSDISDFFINVFYEQNKVCIKTDGWKHTFCLSRSHSLSPSVSRKLL